MPRTGPPALRERPDGRHDRREPRHRAGPQVVAVREAAGQNDDVGALQVGVLVPEIVGLLAEHDLWRREARPRRSCCRERRRCRISWSVNLDAITLDDGVGQHFVGHLSGQRLRPGRGVGGRQIELEVLALTDVGDTVVAERVQRVGDGLALAGRTPTAST